MKMNVKKQAEKVYTHGGARGVVLTDEQKLRRTVLNCFLHEGEFYEDGDSITDRLVGYAKKFDPEMVAKVAIEARTSGNVRHAPLLLMAELAKRPDTKDLPKKIFHVIQRADELSEFLLLFWKDREKQNVPRQVKLGLEMAMLKFDEYQFGKYARNNSVLPLKNVLRMVHPRPMNAAQSEIFRRLRHDELAIPDTWETALSAGADKKETFTRLMTEGKLPYMALLRNLRNMLKSGVDPDLIRKSLMNVRAAKRVLPFRFLAAAKQVPQIEEMLSEAFIAFANTNDKLPGKTVVIVDMSGSMGRHISSRSAMTGYDATFMLVSILREICEEVVIYATAGDDYKRKHATMLIPNRHTFALSDALEKSCATIGHGGIFLKQATDFVYDKEPTFDRLVVITDEQDTSGDDSIFKVDFKCDKNYLINVASCEVGIGYRDWVHIDGFSSSSVEYIREYEKLLNQNN